MALPLSISPDLRKLLAFGQGVGVQIHGDDLEVAVARVRPNRVQVQGRFTVARFTARPAAEWGAEFTAHLKRLSAAHLAATVMLPRRDVIVRQITLPGVAAADMEGAIRFQLDSLHPYGEDEIAWGWSKLGAGAVLIGITPRAALDRYIQSFLEAGIAVSSFTFSAAAIHSAIRLNGGTPPGGFLALSAAAGGAVEAYGESPARPVFSAEFDMPVERAAALAAAELRLDPDAAAFGFDAVLPKPAANPVENDIARNPMPYAAAVAAATPHFAPAVNLLPPELRKSTSRAMLVPSIVLAAALAAIAISMLVYSRIADRNYLKGLEAEIARLEPRARRAAALDKEIGKARSRAQLLDEIRGRTLADLDALNELTRLIAPPAWSNAVDMARDSVRVSGEASQASGLIKIIDSSPLFQGSEFSVVQRTANSESFQIRTNRRARK